MRIFAIKDDTMPQDAVLGYLIYHEPSKSFYIEVPDGADSWDMPLILSSFADRGEYSIDSAWSRRFVQQRIVPQDRQNIGQILRDNGLGEYDEFSLLMLTMGRCEQDDCYLEEIREEQLPGFLSARWKTKVDEVVPMECPRLLVFFRNGVTKIVDIQEIAPASAGPYLASQDRFNTVEVQGDLLAHGVEQLVLDRDRAILRAEDPALKLLELRGDVALTVRQRLLTDIGLGDEVLIRIGDLYVVAEYTVVTDL